MPTYRPNRPHPWLARAKRNGIEWVLGYYDTQNDACIAEWSFDDLMPRKIQQYGKNQTKEYGQ